MSKFIGFTCLFVFWAFYELSGGADFEPRPRVVATAEPVVETPEVVPEPVAAVAVATPQAEPEVKVMTAGYSIIPAPDTPAKIVSDITLASAETVAVSEELPENIKIVAGNRVNMRDGPSTDYIVLDTLPRGTQAEVMSINGDGWVQVRLISNGRIGWMAGRLLADG